MTLLLLGLSGCGSVEIRSKPDSVLSFGVHASVPEALPKRLATVPACCASLAELPYRNVTEAGTIRAAIGLDSPAYNFDSGKSFFAAYRIDNLPRPLALRIGSSLTADPTSISRLIGMPGNLIFAPVVLILDERFNIRRTMEPGKALATCVPSNGNSAGDVYVTTFDIEEPADQAKYIIVMTTDALRATDGESMCGAIRHGLSSVGNITVNIAIIDLHDGSIAIKSEALWHPETKDPGGFAGFFQDPGLLILGNTALHFLAQKDLHYQEHISIPYDSIVSLPRNRRMLVIGAQDPPGTNTRYQSFELWNSPSAEIASTSRDEIRNQLAARIRPQLTGERVAFVVTTSTPVLEFRTNTEGGTASRVGEWALTGGVATALPCGVCASGVCGPEVLAPCAALFSVGAVVGGTLGIGHEVVTTVAGVAAPPAVKTGDVKQSMTPMIDRAKGEQSGRVELLKCIGQVLAGETVSDWLDQGRSAQLSVVAQINGVAADSPESLSGLAVQGYGYSMESVVSRIALVSDEEAAKTLAEVPVRLRLESQVGFRDLSDKHAKTKTAMVAWESQPHALDDWTHSGPQLVAEAADQGCRELAGKIVDAANQFWMQE